MNYYPIDLSKIRAKVATKKAIKISRVQKRIDWGNDDNVKEISNDFGETITRVDGNIPIDLKVTKGQRFLFISYDQSRYSHGIHKYPAKFFPELPRWLINRYSKKGDMILDPFAGSATTNIEALLSNRNSIGIDIDPFARLLAKVKTTPLNKKQLNDTVETLLKKVVRFNPKSITAKDIPDFPYMNSWFTKDILFELAYLKKIINNTETSQDIKDFCNICLSSIIRHVSNADDNCTRTVVRKKLNKQIYPSMALGKFAENLLVNSYRINEYTDYFQPDASIEFPLGNDARYFTCPDNYFELAITSPPYVNAVDYPRTHQLEMYWLGLVKGSLSPIKQTHIGTEVVKVADYKILHKIGVPEADNKLAKIYAKDPRRAYIAYKYLYDMKLNFKEVYRSLKKNGRYAIVVGNNTMRGENFESWKYFLSIGDQVGFKVDTYFGSEIIKHFIKVPREERINTDWVIVFQK